MLSIVNSILAFPRKFQDRFQTYQRLTTTQSCILSHSQIASAKSRYWSSPNGDLILLQQLSISDFLFDEWSCAELKWCLYAGLKSAAIANWKWPLPRKSKPRYALDTSSAQNNIVSLLLEYKKGTTFLQKATWHIQGCRSRSTRSWISVKYCDHNLKDGRNSP